MAVGSTLFAYFGPEVQMPMTSLIGAFSGIVLIVGAVPVRLIKRWLEEIRQVSRS
jgi:hypothetical protein